MNTDEIDDLIGEAFNFAKQTATNTQHASLRVIPVVWLKSSVVCPLCDAKAHDHMLREPRNLERNSRGDDDESGKLVEGNIVMAGSHVSAKAIAFMVKHGSGEDLERLKLPLMSPENEDAPSLTITLDAKVGTSAGVSASDRAKTVLALSSPGSRPEDFRRPGHVFPLKYRNGGVLRRVGHTEASVGLIALAHLQPVSVLSSIVDTDNSSMASMAALRKLALDYSIPIIGEKREKLVKRSTISRLPTNWGMFQAHCYRSNLDGMEHIAIVKGDIGNGQDVQVRVHSSSV
ncbi:monofunctional riboflavin biosynthesis protein riba 3 chloroplastic [Phtheirospermum japonicum]|uniref:Monofunctional riboflavin biosynthesis protein riba 3 chloroplastic n=1 Tax=Phtheirospermum japonicum TaxID=374723 RepID=A0A830CVI7_9LAMI|nr:monofunctional riboflavin biosynthesis protein riba 3 chloroplastic [Phtheirospermum japonicum]